MIGFADSLGSTCWARTTAGIAAKPISVWTRDALVPSRAGTTGNAAAMPDVPHRRCLGRWRTVDAGIDAVADPATRSVAVLFPSARLAANGYVGRTRPRPHWCCRTARRSGALHRRDAAVRRRPMVWTEGFTDPRGMLPHAVSDRCGRDAAAPPGAYGAVAARGAASA